MSRNAITGMLAMFAMSGCAEVVRGAADVPVRHDDGGVMAWVDAMEIDAVGVVCGHLGERDVPYLGAYHCPVGWVCHEYGTALAEYTCCADPEGSPRVLRALPMVRVAAFDGPSRPCVGDGTVTIVRTCAGVIGRVDDGTVTIVRTWGLVASSRHPTLHL